MKSYAETIEMLKMLAVVCLPILLIVACCERLDRDEKRMFQEFMQECKKQKTQEDCGVAYLKAYRETFGR